MLCSCRLQNAVFNCQWHEIQLFAGKRPIRGIPHGNATKNLEQEFVRASRETLKHVRQAVARDTAGKAYTNLRRNDVDVRNREQVANMRKRLIRQNTTLRNHADEVQYLQNLLHTNSEDNIVQGMFADRHKQPSAVMFNDHTINHIKQFCTARRRTPSVLGIDRYFF